CLVRPARLRKGTFRPARPQARAASESIKCLIPLDQAGMAELVDARDLKSLGAQALCRFDSGCPHQHKRPADAKGAARQAFVSLILMRPLVLPPPRYTAACATGSWWAIRA